MSTESWYFIYDQGVRMAAFPERDLAELYSEGTNWAIRKEPIIVRDASKFMPCNVPFRKG